MSTSTEPSPGSIQTASSAAFHSYVVSGLKVSSAVELPSAIVSPAPHDAADVVIELGEVPPAVQDQEDAGPDWSRSSSEFVLRIEGVMRVWITAGRRIVVEPVPGSDPGDRTLFLLGTCFAILLHQRGRVVLHASAVAVGEVAMLFCGQSGAGKSTLAAMLGKRGYPLVNDDVCNLSPFPDGGFAVHPDGRMLKLWGRSLDYLHWHGSPDSMVRRNTDKFYMPPETSSRTPRRVGGVYMLETLEDDSAAPVLEAMRSAAAMASLQANAYRPALVHAMKMQREYFAAAIDIQRHAGVYRLARPMQFARADDVADLLEQHWRAAILKA